jgi:hypothetical protein
VYAAIIESAELDRRGNLDVPNAPCELAPSLRRRPGEVLRRLELATVFDLKVDDDSGEEVFLEHNPQGQFLFIEGPHGYGPHLPLRPLPSL